MCQSNPLNINLMYSSCFCLFVQQTVRLLLNPNRLAGLKYLYITIKRTICSYAVIQLCSFFLRGVKRDEKKFYYIYNNYIFSKKATKSGKWAKKNCITA